MSRDKSILKRKILLGAWFSEGNESLDLVLNTPKAWLLCFFVSPGVLKACRSIMRDEEAKRERHLSIEGAWLTQKNRELVFKDVISLTIRKRYISLFIVIIAAGRCNYRSIP